MSNRISPFFCLVVLMMHFGELCAAPLDVDGDGIVGPQEALDLAESWKGPALPSGGAQPWQIDGATIFYNTGKVGVGSAAPHHQLRVSGGPIWTANGWTGSLELDNSAAIGWGANSENRSFGIGQTSGGLLFFHTTSSPGTTEGSANYDLTIGNSGNVGIGAGATAPAFPLTIDTGAAGYGWVHSDGVRQLGSFLNADGGWLGTKTNDPLHLFTNDSPPQMTITTSGSVGIGTQTPNPMTRLNVLTNADGHQAIRGDSPNGNGVIGANNRAGYAATAGVNAAAAGVGVFGEADSGLLANGVWGKSNEGIGVYGISNSAQGADSAGVLGRNTASNGNGVIGEANTGPSAYGVYGRSSEGTGVIGEGRGGVSGRGEIGLFGEAVGVDSRAGVFLGKVDIIGELDLTGSFTHNGTKSQIDHPLDPANKFLLHTSVESSERKNVYDGNVVTDETGHAEVHLPDWFETLNGDFRYQLTVVGQFAQAIIQEKIQDNFFTIRTDRPNVEVSWQVTGIRHDPYAKANPLEVETMKTPEERGKYLNPELYGQPKEKGIHHGVKVGPQTVKVPTAGK